MKILMTTDLYKPTVNGVVISIDTLKQELEKQGHEVRILTLGKKTAYEHDKKIYTVKSINAGLIYPGARVAIMSDEELLQSIIQWGPDIIHSHVEFSTFRWAYQLKQLCKIPIIHTYHTVYEDYTHYFSPSKTMGRQVVSTISRYLSRRVDSIIAPTSKVSEMLTNYGIKTPIHIIPTGIPLEKFRQKHKESKLSDLRNDLKIPTDHKVLLFLGRLAKEKNVEELIAYLDQSELNNWTFIIVGGGPHRERLEELTSKSKNSTYIRFIGMINPIDVPLYYQLSDIFMSASTSETQGLTYIEALAASRPVLCRNDKSLDDVIVYGENGYTYSNQNEFENILKTIFSSEEHLANLKTEAGRYAEENFSATSFGENVKNIYIETISRYQHTNFNEEHHYDTFF